MRKKTIEDCRELAKSRSGKCLSEVYVNNKSNLEWCCEEGHKWNMTYDSIRNRWCQQCTGLSPKNQKHPIEYCHEVAKNRGGKCLNDVYTICSESMMWECNIGHVWNAVFSEINKGSWCPECSVINRRLPDGISKAKLAAKDRGGICKSTEYLGAHKKLTWECDKGHEWECNFGDIRRGSWCPECAGKKKLTLKLAVKIAEDRGGSCISKTYVNTKTKMKWRCKDGHMWYAPLDSIKNRNSWCRKCSYLVSARKLTNSCIINHWKTGEELVCVASYEKAVVEYLNLNKINFKWQHKTFTLPSGRTYRPDMYLVGKRNPWVEIKGYFMGNAKEKWDWFQTIKPNSELWDGAKLKEMGIL